MYNVICETSLLARPASPENCPGELAAESLLEPLLPAGKDIHRMEPSLPNRILKGVGSIFWNREQRRLRLFFRLTIFLWIYSLFNLGIALLQGVLFHLLGGSSSPEELLSLSGPSGFQIVGPLLMTAAVLVSMLLASWTLDRRSFRDYGFNLNRRWWMDLAFGLLLGAVVMLAIFLIEWLLGWIEVTPSWQAPDSGAGLVPALMQGLVLFLCVGVYEEALFRGYLLRNMAEGFHARWWSPNVAVALAVLIGSFSFGLAHAANPNASLLSSLLISVAGLMLAAGFVLTGELAIPIGIHITWNFFQGYVFGFPVSGMRAGSSIIRIIQRGPELWTGGAFGPEAGLIGLLAMVSLTAAVWLYCKAAGSTAGVSGRLVRPTLLWELAEKRKALQEKHADMAEQEGEAV